MRRDRSRRSSPLLALAAPAQAADVSVHFDAAGLTQGQNVDDFYLTNPGFLFGPGVENPQGGEFPTYDSCSTSIQALRIRAVAAERRAPGLRRDARVPQPARPVRQVHHRHAHARADARRRHGQRRPRHAPVGLRRPGPAAQPQRDRWRSPRTARRSRRPPGSRRSRTSPSRRRATASSRASGSTTSRGHPGRRRPAAVRDGAHRRQGHARRAAGPRHDDRPHGLPHQRLRGERARSTDTNVPEGVDAFFTSSVNGKLLNVRAAINAPVTGQTEPVIVVTGTPANANTGTVVQRVSVPIRVTPAITRHGARHSEPRRAAGVRADLDRLRRRSATPGPPPSPWMRCRPG